MWHFPFYHPQDCPKESNTLNKCNPRNKVGVCLQDHYPFHCYHAPSCRQVYLIEAKHPTAPLRCVQPRLPGLEYFVEHHNGDLIIMTNLARARSSNRDGCDRITAFQVPGSNNNTVPASHHDQGFTHSTPPGSPPPADRAVRVAGTAESILGESKDDERWKFSSSYSLMMVSVSDSSLGLGIESWRPLLESVPMKTTPTKKIPGLVRTASSTKDARIANTTSSAVLVASDPTFEIVDMDVLDKW